MPGRLLPFTETSVILNKPFLVRKPRTLSSLRVYLIAFGLLWALLLVLPGEVSAQVPLDSNRVARERLFERMLGYGATVEMLTAPYSIEESVRFVMLRQEKTASKCDHTLYVFKPSQAPQYYVKKFTVTSWEDTVLVESPLVPLSAQHSADLDRLFRQASRIVLLPYSVHFSPLSQAKYKEKDLERKDYWQVAFLQRSPYRPAFSRWGQENSLNKDPINKGIGLAWRKKRTLHRLRRILREFTSCP